MNKLSICGGMRKTQKKGCNSKRKMKGGYHIYQVRKIIPYKNKGVITGYKYKLYLVGTNNDAEKSELDYNRLVDGLKSTNEIYGKQNFLNIGDFLKKENPGLFNSGGKYTLVNKDGTPKNLPTVPVQTAGKKTTTKKPTKKTTTKKPTTKKPVKKTTTKKPVKKTTTKKPVKKTTTKKPTTKKPVKKTTTKKPVKKTTTKKSTTKKLVKKSVSKK